MEQHTDTLNPLDWTLGDRLAKARRMAGISSEEMAERLIRTRSTVSNYEHDRTRPTLAVLRAWSEATGAPLDWLRGVTVGYPGELTERDIRELVAA